MSPTKPKHYCVEPRCPEFIPSGQSYCKQHLQVEEKCTAPGCMNTVKRSAKYRLCYIHRKENAQKYESERENATDRGYDDVWKKCRKMYMNSVSHLCELDKTMERIVSATQVHHIIPLSEGGARLDDKNLMALCDKCHSWVRSKKGVSWLRYHKFTGTMQ